MSAVLKPKSNLTHFKTHREGNFTTVNNKFINDTSLDWESKGLLLYLLSRPPEWQVVMSDLINKSKNGKDSVYRIMKDLQKARYLKREVIRNEKGQVEKNIYHVFEIPYQVEPFTENPEVDKPPLLNINTKENNTKNKEERKKEVEEKKKVTDISEAPSFNLSDPDSDKVQQQLKNYSRDKIKPEIKMLKVLPEYQSKASKFLNEASEVLGQYVLPFSATRDYQKHALNDIYIMINQGLLDRIDEDFIAQVATQTVNKSSPDFYLQDLVKFIIARLRQFRSETEGEDEVVVRIIKTIDNIQIKRNSIKEVN